MLQLMPRPHLPSPGQVPAWQERSLLSVRSNEDRLLQLRASCAGSACLQIFLLAILIPRLLLWFPSMHPLEPVYCWLAKLVCCRTQFRFSPSIARSQYSPIKRPLGFDSDRLSTTRRTWNSLTTLSMVSFWL